MPHDKIVTLVLACVGILTTTFSVLYLMGGWKAVAVGSLAGVMILGSFVAVTAIAWRVGWI